MNSFVIFLFISFGIASPLFYISTQQTSPAIVALLLLLGSYAPALGAWIAASRDDEAEQAFRQRLMGWTGGRWVGWAFLVPSVIWLASFGISILLNQHSQPVWVALAALPVIFLVNYGEEIGWRGYALPYLMKRFNPLASSLILGVIWALFHAGLYWQKPRFGLMASVIIVLISISLTWMFVNTRRILPGTLFHAMFNAWTQVFVTDPNDSSMLLIVIVLLAGVAGLLSVRYGKRLLILQ